MRTWPAFALILALTGLTFTARADHWVQLAPLALIPDRLETWVLAGFLILLIGLRVVR